MAKTKNSAGRAIKQLNKQAAFEKRLAEKEKQRIAKAQIKELRKVIKSLKQVDLRKKVNPQKRGYIDKAWKEYQELTARPHKVYRTRNKKRLKVAQEFSRHDNKKPKFDVAFVPTADPNAKIKFNKDSAVIKSKYVTETVVFFDLKKLAANPKAEIEKAIGKKPKAKEFAIMAGKYQYNGGLSPSLVENEVLKLMAKYGNPQSNKYFENWLFGLIAAEFDKQEHIKAYRREFERAREARKKARKNARRNRGYKYGKKF